MDQLINNYEFLSLRILPTLRRFPRSISGLLLQAKYRSCLNIFFLFQGPPGQRGPAGQPGEKGPMVRSLKRARSCYLKKHCPLKYQNNSLLSGLLGQRNKTYDDV